MALALFLLLPIAARAEGIAVKSAELESVEEALVLHAEMEVSLSPALEDALNKGVPLNFIADFELKKPRWYWLDETIVTAQRHLRLSYHALTRQYQVNVEGQYQNFSSLADARRELGRLNEWRVVEKSLLAEKPPVASKAPALEKAPTTNKAPTSEKAPAVSKVPASEKALATDKAPISEKTPVTDKPPLPVSDKVPALEKAPVLDKASAPEKAPTRKHSAYVAGLRMKLDLTQLPKPLQVNALTSKDWNLDSEWHRWNVTP
ncbi:MAG: DUF4390 domain-containing protein [Betaproteobacteria bacterium]|nr:DUF4390 domain-containing protein [Betaproteobacteria bacterium]